MSGYNVRLDRRHDRRALTDDELSRLIQAAENGKPVRGMIGHDRAILYRLAVGTGFRANEIASLMPESFDLDADPPMVTIEAGYSKHRRKDEQPIRDDLAELLRAWLRDKTPCQPVFKMPAQAADLMQADLKAARNSWLDEACSGEERGEREKSSFLAYRNSAGLVADFHALRHTFVSRLVLSGANVNPSYAVVEVKPPWR